MNEEKPKGRVGIGAKLLGGVLIIGMLSQIWFLALPTVFFGPVFLYFSTAFAFLLWRSRKSLRVALVFWVATTALYIGDAMVPPVVLNNLCEKKQIVQVNEDASVVPGYEVRDFVLDETNLHTPGCDRYCQQLLLTRAVDFIETEIVQQNLEDRLFGESTKKKEWFLMSRLITGHGRFKYSYESDETVSGCLPTPYKQRPDSKNSGCIVSQPIDEFSSKVSLVRDTTEDIGWLRGVTTSSDVLMHRASGIEIARTTKIDYGQKAIFPAHSTYRLRGRFGFSGQRCGRDYGRNVRIENLLKLGRLAN